MSDESKVHRLVPPNLTINSTTRAEPTEQFTTNFGSYRLTWTNGVVNLIFLCIYGLLQLSAVVLLRQLDYKSFALGIEIFTMATIMEFCLVIQPPQLMKWIPFWENSVGRGVVILLVSVMAMSGLFMIGFVCMFLSIGVICASAISGTYDVAPPVLDYYKVFPSHNGHRGHGPVASVQSYNSIPTLEE